MAASGVQQFQSVVETPEVTGAMSFLEIPPQVIETLGTKKRLPVTVTLNGYTYRTTVAVYGGRYYVPVRREVRETAKVTPGEPLDVSMEVDAAPRTVEEPEDLAAALNANGEARSTFDFLSYSHRKEYVQWITSAKREETRRRRVEQTNVMLHSGRKSPKS